MTFRFTMGLFLGLLLCLMVEPVWAQSDDEDTTTLYRPRPKKEEKAKTQRIGVLRTQLDESAMKKVNPGLLDQVERVLKKAMSMINTRDVEVLSPDEVESNLAPKYKRQLAGCGTNKDCMISALQPASLDLFLASSLTYLDGDYKLSVQWVNTQSRKEQSHYDVLVTNPTTLPKKAGILTVRALIGYGMYVRVQEGEAVATTADDAESKPDPLEEERQLRRHDTGESSMAMTVSKWTTLGVGIASLAAGAALNVMAFQAESDAKNGATPEAVANGNDDSKLYGITAYSLYGLGGALLVTSTVLFILDANRTGTSNVMMSSAGVGIMPDGSPVVSASLAF